MYRFGVVALGVLVLLAGCTASRKANESDVYAQAAQTAVEGGDWATARRQWALAIEAGELGGIDEGALASLYYEYGRAAGATCMFDLATDNFGRAFELEQETDGPSYLAQAELGRLELTRKNYTTALQYLERALKIYTDTSDNDAASDPLVALKMDIAKALEALGQVDKADATRMEVYKLRERDSRTQMPLNFEPTPYGEFCLS
jgi:tetratricopeptide (TPR) repeat protein